VGGARTIKEACETLSSGQICPFIASLNAQSCPLPYKIARVDIS